MKILLTSDAYRVFKNKVIDYIEYILSNNGVTQNRAKAKIDNIKNDAIKILNQCNIASFSSHYTNFSNNGQLQVIYVSDHWSRNTKWYFAFTYDKKSDTVIIHNFESGYTLSNYDTLLNRKNKNINNSYERIPMPLLNEHRINKREPKSIRLTESQLYSLVRKMVTEYLRGKMRR